MIETGPPGVEEVLGPELVKAAVEAVRRRIELLKEEFDAVRVKLDAAEQEERLLLRLLEFRTGQRVSRVDDQKAAVAPELTDDASRHPALVAAFEELEKAGRPLHISDLMRLLAGRRIELPGAGTQANLITHLRRDPRIIRASRGMYALASWGIEPEPAQVRRARRRRILVRASRKGTAQ
jgi:hypothetical protein